VEICHFQSPIAFEGSTHCRLKSSPLTMLLVAGIPPRLSPWGALRHWRPGMVVQLQGGKELSLESHDQIGPV
jgi:hypothetical protein